MKTRLIVTIVFFVVVHTQDLWSEYLGVMYLFIIPIVFGAFLFVLGSFFYELFLSFREKFQHRKRNFTLLIMSIVIGLTVYEPFGIIKHHHFEAEDLIIANREGAANCMTTLRLKKDQSFVESTFCFGVSRTQGMFKIIKDTIWFTSREEYYDFATIGPNAFDSTRRYINLHENDSITNWLIIQQ